MQRSFRLTFLVALGVALAVSGVVFVLRPGHAPAATSADVGVGVAGQNSFEFIARIDQTGTEFATYGYLTHIAGLPATLLFTDPLTRTEATARFTFSGTATLTGRSVISNVFVLDAAGPLVFYFSPTPGADFADPASFVRGDAIATYNVRFQNILTVIAPNSGLATGVGELDQASAQEFTLNSQSYRLGRGGLQQRMSINGSALRLEPTIPRSITMVGGNAFATGDQLHLPQLNRGER